MRFEGENREDCDLYLSVLAIDSAGAMSVIFPHQWTASAESTVLPAQQTLSIPNRDRDRFRLVTQPPLGTTEILIVASTKPMVDALKGLQAIANECGFRDCPIPVTDPKIVIEILLADP